MNTRIWRWPVLSLALLVGCASQPGVFNDHAPSSERMPPTNPGGGNGNNQDTGILDCYSFTDNSADLTLLNPNDVEVLHYTDTELAAQGEARNILMVFTNHSGTPITPVAGSGTEFSMSEFGDMFFDNDAGARRFFEEASFGDLSLTGTVIGWMDFADSTTSNLSVNGGGFLALADQ